VNSRDLAMEAIRRVHCNTSGTLEDVREDLEGLRDLADELVEAVTADIQMQQKDE
jgi:hypothetical protein